MWLNTWCTCTGVHLSKNSVETVYLIWLTLWWSARSRLLKTESWKSMFVIKWSYVYGIRCSTDSILSWSEFKHNIRLWLHLWRYLLPHIPCVCMYYCHYKKNIDFFFVFILYLFFLFLTFFFYFKYLSGFFLACSFFFFDYILP